MWKCVVVLVFLAVPVVSLADIYRYEDEEGVVSFTEAPQAGERDKWKAFAKGIEKKTSAKVPKSVHRPVPAKYIYRDVSPADGTIYAVKSTNVKGTYYWYMGTYGDYVATCKNGKILLNDGIAVVSLKNNEVVFESVVSRNVWLEGTLGYEMYNITISHATTR